MSIGHCIDQYLFISSRAIPNGRSNTFLFHIHEYIRDANRALLVSTTSTHPICPQDCVHTSIPQASATVPEPVTFGAARPPPKPTKTSIDEKAFLFSNMGQEEYDQRSHSPLSLNKTRKVCQRRPTDPSKSSGSLCEQAPQPSAM